MERKPLRAKSGRSETYGWQRIRRQLQAFKKNVRSKESFSALPWRSSWATVRTKLSMTGGTQFVCCSTLATSGGNDAPHASPFAEQSALNAVLPLKDGGP
jgi:hypothetical protein